SRAGPTTRRLGDEPALIERLRARLGDVEDRYIHVVRNPYDPISAMVRRGRRTLDDAIDDYARQSRRMVMLRHLLAGDRLLTVHYERFVAAPSDQLRRVCDFLGLDRDPGYLSACAEIVDATRRPERQAVHWTPDAVAAVDRLIDQFDFLDGYAYTR
ncbi:MAG TPA: sulfotransferase, partial [Euzebyales bacterium]|nr:sulfotransferase [Euzebyales bacterium]